MSKDRIDELQEHVRDYMDNIISMTNLQSIAREILPGLTLYYDSGLYGPLGTIYRTIEDPLVKLNFKRKVQSDVLAQHKQRAYLMRNQIPVLEAEIADLQDRINDSRQTLNNALTHIEGIEEDLNIIIGRDPEELFEFDENGNISLNDFRSGYIWDWENL
jgi:hypothetical protein